MWKSHLFVRMRRCKRCSLERRCPGCRGRRIGRRSLGSRSSKEKNKTKNSNLAIWVDCLKCYCSKIDSSELNYLKHNCSKTSCSKLNSSKLNCSKIISSKFKGTKTWKFKAQLFKYWLFKNLLFKIQVRIKIKCSKSPKFVSLV